VTQYQSAYEPYVVVRRDAGVWCVFLDFFPIFTSVFHTRSVAGAMKDSPVMGATKRLVCSKCMCLGSRFTY
jgi:hypothetical protein